jgi:hypothetical protein
MTSEEKQREEEKRWRMYDPVRRWHDLLDMIAFAEATMPAHWRRSAISDGENSNKNT